MVFRRAAVLVVMGPEFNRLPAVALRLGEGESGESDLVLGGGKGLNP